MENENNKTRREFLGDVLKTGSVAALGGLVCIGLSPEASRAKDTLNNFLLAFLTSADLLIKQT